MFEIISMLIVFVFIMLLFKIASKIVKLVAIFILIVILFSLVGCNTTNINHSELNYNVGEIYGNI